MTVAVKTGSWIRGGDWLHPTDGSRSDPPVGAASACQVGEMPLASSQETGLQSR